MMRYDDTQTLYNIQVLDYLKMMQYNKTGLPREIKKKPVYNALNYTLLGIIIIMILWWLLKK